MYRIVTYLVRVYVLVVGIDIFRLYSLSIDLSFYIYIYRVPKYSIFYDWREHIPYVEEEVEVNQLPSYDTVLR